MQDLMWRIRNKWNTSLSSFWGGKTSHCFPPGLSINGSKSLIFKMKLYVDWNTRTWCYQMSPKWKWSYACLNHNNVFSRHIIIILLFNIIIKSEHFLFRVMLDGAKVFFESMTDLLCLVGRSVPPSSLKCCWSVKNPFLIVIISYVWNFFC